MPESILLLYCRIKDLMKSSFTERLVVLFLFVLVFITFSLAQRDSKRLEKLYTLGWQTKPGVASKNAVPALTPVK